MRLLTHFLIAIIAAQGLCRAGIGNLPTDDQRILGDVSRFHEVHGVKNLPMVVLRLCADSSGSLAEPGKKWQATDIAENLPRNRLIWAVTGSNYYVVHYECGGIAHSYHVLFAKLKD